MRSHPDFQLNDAAFKVGEDAFRAGRPCASGDIPEIAALIRYGADSYAVQSSFCAGWVAAGSRAEASELPLDGFDSADSISAQTGGALDLDFIIALMPMNPDDARSGAKSGVILFFAPGKSWGDSHLRKHGAKYLATARASLACAQLRDLSPRAMSNKYRGPKALERLAAELVAMRYSESAVSRFLAAARPFCPVKAA